VPLNYGEVAAWHLDPIEKKPLFHFYPGSWIFSVAGYGCNLSCTFCQNHEISQSCQQGTRVTPARLAELAQTKDSLGLCFTYSEPSTWFEMANDKTEEIRELSQWLRKLNTPLAWHLSRYFPAYKLDLPPTEKESLLKLWKLAQEEVEYVYLGNVSGGDSTYCPHCGKEVIIRENARILNLVQDGHCPECDYKFFGVGL